MLSFVIIELLIMRFILKEEIPVHEIVANLNSGHILLWIFRGLEIAGFSYALNYLSLDLLQDWPLWTQWMFTFFAWDFCFYWLHRIHHQLPSLWSIHVVHHEGEHFNLSLGIRNSWFSSLTSLPFFLPLAIIGVPLEQFILVGATHYFIQFYNHTHLVRRSGWLEHVLITPSHHRVHHGHEELYRNRNFGGTLVVWDKLFGTFQPEIPEQPPTFGVDYQPSANPLWINTIPIFRYIANTWKQWELGRRTYQLAPSLILSAGLILFALLVIYVRVEASWTLQPLGLLFAYTFLGTLCVGGLMEGHRWALWGWVSVTLSGLLALSFFPEWQSSISLQLCTTALLLHACMCVTQTKSS